MNASVNTSATSSASGRSATSRWQASEWWYLIFLVNLVFQPVFDPDAGVGSWVSAASIAAIFIPIYLLATMHDGWVRRWAPHLATALGAAAFPLNAGSVVLFVYAGAFAASSMSRSLAYRWLTGLSLLTITVALFVPAGAIPNLAVAFAAFGFPAVLVWVVGLSVLDDSERQRSTDQLRIENARIEHLATAAERDRIARDLHDLIGQSLTEVIVRAQLVRRLLDSDPSRARDEAAMIETSSRAALDQVRRAVRGWSEVRLAEELDVARKTLEAAGVRLHIERDPAFDPPPTTESALAMSLREAVTNIVRHAAAKNCSVRMSRDGTEDLLSISDDGCGGVSVEGMGLRGMRERVMALGGSVRRDSDGGTTVTVRVPGGLAA